jgi:sugar phosphate isomerase/epimerase
MNDNPCFSRRQFLQTSATAASAFALAGALPSLLWAAEKFAPPVALFDKVLHQIKLSLEDSAALIEEAGLDGVDCAVRPNDRIEPSRVKDDLPRYAELLQKRGRKLLLLTTAIQNPTSPNARDILETARRLGVKIYRVGFLRLAKDSTPAQQIAELKPRLRDLVALNKELGMCAVVQNHSPSGNSGYLGGNLADMYEIVKDFPPAQLGVAFDLGHALVVHGDDWKKHFEQLKPHLGVAYIKDADRKRRFVAFGEGEFGQTDYFTRLKQVNYSAPFSMHIEYDWAKGGEQNRAALARALRESLATLRKWVAAA